MKGVSLRILEDELEDAVAIDVSLDAEPDGDSSWWCIHIVQGGDEVVVPIDLGERFALELLAAAATLGERAREGGKG